MGSSSSTKMFNSRSCTDEKLRQRIIRPKPEKPAWEKGDFVLMNGEVFIITRIKEEPKPGAVSRVASWLKKLVRYKPYKEKVT